MYRFIALILLFGFHYQSSAQMTPEAVEQSDEKSDSDKFQNYISFKIGTTFPFQRVERDNLYTSPDFTNTYAIGGNYSKSINTNLTFFGDVSLLVKGANFEIKRVGNNDFERWTYPFFDLNFGVKTYLFTTKNVDCEIYGATGAGILLSGRYKEMTNKVSTSEPIEITDDYNRLEWTWIGGLIFRPNVLDKKLFLEFRTGSSFTSMVKEDVFGAKVFNPYQQIMVGYSFGE